jgi:excisionase family DNA binding protein
MLTASEASKLLHVHINTLRRWTNQGILKAYRIGSRGDRRFKRDDIVRFINYRAPSVKQQPSLSVFVKLASDGGTGGKEDAKKQAALF